MEDQGIGTRIAIRKNALLQFTDHELLQMIRWQVSITPTDMTDEMQCRINDLAGKLISPDATIDELLQKLEGTEVGLLVRKLWEKAAAAPPPATETGNPAKAMRIFSPEAKAKIAAGQKRRRARERREARNK